MILEFITSHLRDVVIIVTVYLVGHVALALYARKIGRRAAEHGASRGRSTRAKTVARLIHDVLHAVLLIIVAFWILRLFDIDPTPIIASAGVVGLAIGFGAQALVKDFISGLFLIAENQYGVGDEVKIGGYEGVVESLSIRSTVLRDKDGNTVFVPNGSVTTVVNMKR